MHMRRATDRAVLTCPQTARERAAANEIKTALAIDTDANLVRTALSMLALHVNARADMTLWAVRPDPDVIERPARRERWAE